MKKIFAIMVIGALCGCQAAPTEQTYAPDGNPASKVSCQGVPNDFTGCYAKAGDICGSKGYKVVEKANGVGLNTVLVECR